jgi:putative ABC transport system permease protein
MKIRSLILKSARFYARSHVGTGIGAAVGAAALVGALAVGDSLRGSLRERALQRLGWIHLAMAPQDRYFAPELAKSFSDFESATALALPGIVTSEAMEKRATHVGVFGIGSNFFGSNQPAVPQPGEVLVNGTLADATGAKVGDELLLRIPKPFAVSREIAVTPHNEETIGFRLRVARILGAKEMGDFSLRNSQVPPANAFVNLEELSEKAGISNRVNLLLLAGTNEARMTEQAQAALRDVKHAAALGLDLTLTPDQKEIELRSDRIFLEPELVRAAEQAPTNAQPTPILTYLANLIDHGTNGTPYSVITAAGPPYTPAELKEDEVVLTDWLARDLQASVGSDITIRYFDPESGAQLAERTNTFRVRSIVPQEQPWSDRTLMPSFPGIQNAESTSDWDGGFPLVYKIRPKDEEYWKQHRGTPKAFVSLAAGQKMWQNRFGSLTAVRWKVPENQHAERFKGEIESLLLAHVEPQALGLRIEDVRQQALKAVSEAQDFGQLFLGFSFFLLLAAMLLMSLLFRFGLEGRLSELGTLLAVGWTPKQVKRTLLVESCLVASIAVLVGTMAGVLYAKALLWALTTIWMGATGTTSLAFHLEPATLFIGSAASLLIAFATMWLTVRNAAKRPPVQLLAGELAAPTHRSGWVAWTLALAAGVAAVGTAIWAWSTGQKQNAEVFFSTGSLLLVSGLALMAALLGRAGKGIKPFTPSVGALAARGIGRRRSRSVTTAALLASGCFVVGAISVFRQDAAASGSTKESGTGGFTLLGELTLPITQDLNTESGLQAFGLTKAALGESHFVQLRVRQGDDASCLNLNQAQRPRLLGVKPGDLEGRFNFTSVANKNSKRGWDLLRAGKGDSNFAEKSGERIEIPAIGDANSIQWALHKKVGDVIEYPAEDGRMINLRLVGAVENSILQGSLLIDEEQFRRYFPNESGYRMLLIQSQGSQRGSLADVLSLALRDVGLELTPTVRRLNQFNAVQNTYLGTFQLLGGIGLLLGSAGLGVVVLRNVLERRSELAVLSAVGFSRSQLQGLVLREHSLLLLAGLLIGLVAAAVAVLPALTTPGRNVAIVSAGLTVLAVLVNGFFWTWLAARRALKGDLLQALRNE